MHAKLSPETHLCVQQLQDEDEVGAVHRATHKRADTVLEEVLLVAETAGQQAGQQATASQNSLLRARCMLCNSGQHGLHGSTVSYTAAPT
jgi:hypothetical protein